MDVARRAMMYIPDHRILRNQPTFATAAFSGIDRIIVKLSDWTLTNHGSATVDVISLWH